VAGAAPSPAARSDSRPGPWLLGGAGAAALAAGVWLALGALADRDDLAGRLEHPADGLIVGIGPAAAREEESSCRTRLGIGGGLAGLGALGLGAGIWLLLRDDGAAPRVTLGPGPAGLALSWR
jgi:hypothetical protein